MILLSIPALLAWLYLIALHGRFWQSGPILLRSRPAAAPDIAPDIAIVVPARDEADLIAASLSSLLSQDYPGRVRVVLVDDGSTDGTAGIARALPDPADRLRVITATDRPAGWAGKLWAVQQGIVATTEEKILLTDADIVHAPNHLATLVAEAEHSGADLVSEMVALNCQSLAERALIPAFVYFFALLYPFAWVNDPLRATAAAAGGTMLIDRPALERIGGIASISAALIDDVALATRLKRAGGRIRLAHATLARSIRPYGWSDIWRMIARSAYVQLRLSPLLLAGTTLGLALIFLVPPLSALFAHSLAGLAAWVLMAATFLPTLHRFRLSPLWAPLLPLMAAFYMAATIASAIAHHRGRGVVWKHRAYTESGA